MSDNAARYKEQTAREDSAALPVSAAQLLEMLEDLGIACDLHEHEPVFTVEESAPLKAEIPGLHCRNLFLRDKKKYMFLVVAGNDTALDLKKLADLLDSARLSFGSADRLWQYLGVRPGSVCPFAIVNDKENEVRLILDKGMMEADIVNYHPMENHLTIGLKPADLLKFARACGHEPWIVDLRPAAPSREDRNVD